MIKDIFEIPEELSDKQVGWLKCMVTLPLTKDVPLKEDIDISLEASKILKEKKICLSMI